MSIWDNIKHEIEVIIHHNPEHLRALKIKVSAETQTLKDDLKQVVEAFLSLKGMPVGQLGEQAAVAALGVITSAFDGDTPVKEVEATPAEPTPPKSLDELEEAH